MTHPAPKRGHPPSPTTGEGGAPPARRGRGRPKAENPRTSRVEIRTTADELELIERAALAAAKPIATWVREIALERAREERGEPAPPSVPLDEAIEAATEALRELAGRRS